MIILRTSPLSSDHQPPCGSFAKRVTTNNPCALPHGRIYTVVKPVRGESRKDHVHEVANGSRRIHRNDWSRERRELAMSSRDRSSAPYERYVASFFALHLI